MFHNLARSTRAVERPRRHFFRIRICVFCELSHAPSDVHTNDALDCGAGLVNGMTICAVSRRPTRFTLRSDTHEVLLRHATDEEHMVDMFKDYEEYQVLMATTMGKIVPVLSHLEYSAGSRYIAIWRLRQVEGQWGLQEAGMRDPLSSWRYVSSLENWTPRCFSILSGTGGTLALH